MPKIKCLLRVLLIKQFVLKKKKKREISQDQNFLLDEVKSCQKIKKDDSNSKNTL